MSLAQPPFPNIPPSRPWLKIGAAILALILSALAGNQVKGAEPDYSTCYVETAVPSRPAYCVTYSAGSAACSGTVVACESGRSLIVSCNHCFAGGRDVDAQLGRSCRSERQDGAADWAGTTRSSRAYVDMCLIVANVALPAAEIDGGLPPVGSAVEHWGRCSGYTRGVLLPYGGRSSLGPRGIWRSTAGSCPGDSGCGVFHDGKLVAVNWGYSSRGEQLGTPIAYLSYLLESTPSLRDEFPTFAAKFKMDTPRPTPEPPVSPPMSPPAVPPSVCPPCQPAPPRARWRPFQRFRR